jgi:tetratricopeptide (TPR) repeat protein
VCLYNLRLYEAAINELDPLIANTGSGGETRAIFYSYSPAEGLSISTDNQLKAEYFLYRGLTYAAMDRAKEAMADMDSAVTLSGQSTDYLVNRGLVYQRLGMKTKATHDYELALEKNPDNQTALVNLFTLDAAKAKSYLNENAEIISDIIVPELLAQLGYDACNEGQFEEGLNYYSKALSMSPSEADWVMNRAICYGKAGLLEQSKEELLRVTTMKDFSTKAYLHLANVLFLQEEYDQAISFYNQFIATEPAYGTAYFNRGISFNKIGKDDLACRDLQIAARLGVSESAKPLQALCNR